MPRRYTTRRYARSTRRTSTSRRLAARRSARLSRRAGMRRYSSNPRPESKFAIINNPITDYNAAATGTGDFIQTIPPISQGDSSQNRDGRKITVYSHTMRGTVRITANRQPQFAYIWMVEDKWMKDYSNATAAEGFNVYLDEGGQSFSPLGTWGEQGYPLNRDRFIIKRRKIRLSYDTAPAGAGTNPTSPDYTAMASFSFKRTFRRGRVMTYASPTSTLPENYNCYCFISIQSYDETFGSLTSSTIRAQTTGMFKFKD